MMKFKNTLVILSLFLFTLSIYGQTKVISGKVITNDSIPLSDVNVVMQRMDSTIINATTTDTNGIFRLNYIADSFRLLFSHVNYAPVILEGGADDVGIIQMMPYTRQLEELSVVANKPLVKVEDGNLSYDMKTLMGNRIFDNAFDLLKEIPLIIGEQNSLKIIGSVGDASIIINGRASHMSTSQLYTYLKSLPAEKIEKVELSYNAPPQWHVRGAAINVIVRKGEQYEVQGQVQGKWDYQHASSYTGIGSLFVSNKKYSYDVIYNYQDARFASQINTYGRHTVGNEVYDIYSVGNWRGNSQNHNLLGNFNYNMPKNHNIGISYYGQFTPKTKTRTATKNNLFSDALSNDAGADYLHDIRLSYDAPFGLSVSGEYTHYKNNRLQDMQYFPKEGNAEDAFQYDRKQRLQRYSVTADMNHKLPKNWNIGYGIQYQHTKSKNWQDYNDRLGSGEDSYKSLSSMNEDLTKAYVIVRKSFFQDNRLFVAVSLSEEYYRLNDYKKNNLIPNANITYRIHPKHIMQLMYSTYRTYPSYWQRQDYVTHQDEYTTSYGNPSLRPSQTHMANFVYIFNNKYVLQMLYYRVNDYFMTQSYQMPNELQLIYQTVNADYNSTFQTTISAPVTIGKKFVSNLSVSAFNNNYKMSHWHDLSFNRSKWAGLFRAVNTFTLSDKPNISINATAFYRTPTIQGIWDMSSSWGLDAGIRWRFAKDKAILNFQCYDIFEKSYSNVKIRYATQWQNMNERKYKRSFMLSFTYKFNNYRERRQRSVDTSRFGTN